MHTHSQKTFTHQWYSKHVHQKYEKKHLDSVQMATPMQQYQDISLCGTGHERFLMGLFSLLPTRLFACA